MKKKVISMLLAGSMVLSLTACGGNTDAAAPAADAGTKETAEETTDEATEEVAEEATEEAASERTDGKFASV